MNSTQNMARCDKHGRPLPSDPNGPKWIMVGRPRTKRERREGGCPQCARERRINQ